MPPFPLPANIVTDALSGGPNIFTQELASLGILPPSWGIFDQNGNVVVTADNVMALDYRQEWTVADYPQERGAFESYDKVASPFEARVTFASGGSFSNRRNLLNSIKAIAGNLKLYDVVTPEETYLSCNISRYDYRRAEGRAGIIQVTVHLLEIRVIAEATLSNTAQPNAAGTENGGQVQADPEVPSRQQSEVFAQVTATQATNPATGEVFQP